MESNYFMPNAFEIIKSKLIKKSNNSTVSYLDYDDTTPKTKNQDLDGIHYKKFVRFDAEYFKDLIHELQTNPECSYQTYLGDLLLDKTYKPKYLSVMLKDIGDTNAINNEILASRICNYMGVPTVYNKKFVENDSNYLLSVDFLQGNNTIIDLSPLLEEIKGDDITINDFGAIERDFSKCLFDISEVFNVNKSRAGKYRWNFDKDKYYEELAYYYLVRTYIIKDNDFFPRNLCNICDENNNIKLGPVFDCESSFFGGTKGFDSVESVAYIKQHFPESFDKFCQNYKRLMTPKGLKKVFADIDDKEYIKSKKEFLNRCYASFNGVCVYADLHNNKNREF